MLKKDTWIQLEDGKWFDISMRDSNLNEAINVITNLKEITIYQKDKEHLFSIASISRISYKNIKQFKKGYFCRDSLQIVGKLKSNKCKLKSGDAHLCVNCGYSQIYCYVFEISRKNMDKGFYQMILVLDWPALRLITDLDIENIGNVETEDINSRFEILDL